MGVALARAGDAAAAVDRAVESARRLRIAYRGYEAISEVSRWEVGREMQCA
jgi:hypothetical protein